MPEIRDISPYQRLGLLKLGDFARQNKLTLKRQIEVEGTRFLLNQLLNGEACDLQYTEHSKPFLGGRTEKISISHSHDLLAILINSKEETGVDIELIRDKVLRIRHKFLNPKEQAFAADNLEKLITLWAAKEAMYKAYGRKQLDFSADMSVEPFAGDEIMGTLRARGGVHSYCMRRERHGDYILVYILNEVPVAHPQAR